MNLTCQHPTRIHSMFAKTSLILALIVSLLFVTQAQPVVLPVEVKQGGACAGMQCARGCCTSTACCAPQEKNAPQPAPMPASQRAGADLAAIGLFTALFLHVLPPVEAKITAAQEAAIPHKLPRLAVSCIFLI
jgi:hypothetical protein